MINLICACTDLGLHIDGTDKGPIAISHFINSDKINDKIVVSKKNVIKEKNINNNQKNIKDIREFLERLQIEVDNSIKNNIFPIVIGGDHTVAISSAFASLKHNNNLGIIWIDAHSDFNTFETTETGNIHGLPLASICGLCQDLTDELTNKYIDPKKCVVVGARSIDKKEYANLEKAGITVFTTDDLNNYGINTILETAFQIAGQKVHVSFDLDVIDPKIAPGVSVPELNGINKSQTMEIINYLNNKKENITSFDLVEYNPSLDQNEITLKIIIDILSKFVN